MRARACIAAIATLTLCVTTARAAAAHDLMPGAVALREIEPGRFSIRITPPLDGSRDVVELVPTLPDGCAFEPAGIVCARDIAGPLELSALADRRVKVLVAVAWLDGTRFEHILREGESRVEIEHQSARAEEVGGWAMIGVGAEHVLRGPDHLLFVLALAMIARSPRRVVTAVTGFTAAHSLTLGITALGLVRPPTAATELVIALSIVLLAGECMSERPTLARRAPWLVALVFGFVHGFGFAGAFAHLGLDEASVAPALLGFNAGVELGQLAVLATVGLLSLALKRVATESTIGRVQRVAAIGIGVTAGAWTVERTVVWLGG